MVFRKEGKEMTKTKEPKLYALETSSHLAVVEAYTKQEAISKSDFSRSQIEIIREATEEDINQLKAMGGYIVK